MSVRPCPPRRIVVSIIVPAYNAEAWVERTLASACHQTLRDIEILVVDDGSTDRTAELVRVLAAADRRIRLIQRENGGVGAARNCGIREARGKYIAPLDADDLWKPRKLEVQVGCMEAAGDEMAMVYCRSEKIDARGRVITAAFASELEGWVGRSLILQNFVGNASVPLFRATALAETGLYLERAEQQGAQGCEDWDLLIRLAERYKVGLVEETLVGYRQLSDCMSLDVPSMSLSYEITMGRARARNPGLAGGVFRWSAGNFYSYLVSKCYLWGEYGDCLRSMARAVRADPVLVTNRKFYGMAVKSLIRLLTGTRARPPWSDPVRVAAPPPAAEPRRTGLFDAIKSRRLKALVEQDCQTGSPEATHRSP